MNLLQEIGPGLPGIGQLRRMMETGRRAGMAETLDIRLVEVEDGRVVFEATPGAQHYNPIGTVHGGFAATVLDFACGYAVLSKLRVGQGYSTIEIKVAYHRAMTADTGLVRGEGTVVKMGRRVTFTEAHLTNRKGEVLASATSSLLILAPAAGSAMSPTVDPG